MASLKQVKSFRDRRATIRLFAFLTVLFFTGLAFGTYFGGRFLHDAVMAERHKQAELRLTGFTKALQTVLRQTEAAGNTLAKALEDGHSRQRPELYRSAVDTYLAATPWTKGVMLKPPGETLVFPSTETQDFESLPLPAPPAQDGFLMGPFRLPDNTRVFVYRFLVNDTAVDLVISLKDIMEAVGFLELEETTKMTVETTFSSDPDNKATVGNSSLDPSSTINSQIKLGNATWTISVAPHPLDDGPHNWARTLKVAAAILALAFVTPFIGLVLLLRARLRDNSSIRQSMGKVENLSRQLEVALNASNIGLWEHDLETNVQIWDDQILKIYGVPSESRVQSFESWLSHLHPNDQPRFRKFNWADAELGRGFLSEYRIITPDGQEKTIRSAGNSFLNSDGRRKIVGVNWDVSADKALQEALESARSRAEAQNLELENARARMEQIALQDALTGVANRRNFERTLEATQEDGVLPRGMKLILIDLDDFKAINDTMGHFYGDEVLRLAARTFLSHLGEKDFLARTGGDEFVVLMTADGDAEGFAQAVTGAFSQPVRIDDRTCRVGVSIGIATAASARDTAGEMLVKADLALYEAKRRGRGRTVHFTHELMAQTFSQKRLADELQEAVQGGQIEAYYQPIFDVTDMRVVGVETLARWRHPHRGLLEPRSFMGVAEQIGLIPDIDEVIFQKALEMLSRCDRENLSLPSISVNISAQRLQDPHLVDRLGKLELPRRRIYFELLESIPFDRAEHGLFSTIRAIRALGIGIDLDDFGSGYASLVGLTQVRPDRLKIAGQLITPIVDSGENLLVIETIARIAQTFGIGVICEGVASRAHSERLMALGCNIQQGYFFCRPMDSDRFVAFLSERSGS
ncbi:bifunctional diguanylate cyclase/phosphodiesterase [Martelella endophytica]|uniref:bifunctional diguanylate cyclase/phosphodiesterase n=1 Tax=Martelella endophytica TaxID=1486262 RepID=UPI000697258F|nr:EAL domain-containing protein [Martelella endophytica]